MVSTIATYQFKLGPWGNFIYLLADTLTKTCAVIDPAWHAESILREALKRNLRITDILCTHSHVDHVNRVDAILEATDARVHMLDMEIRFSGFKAGNLVTHRAGDPIDIGRSTLYAIHTPGHTPGSTSFWHDKSHTLVTGDTLFVNGCGRCDLQGGDPVQMYESLKMLREKFDFRTRIFPGHDYGATTTSTLEYEVKHNRFMILENVSDFVGERMKGRVLNTKLASAPDWRPE